MEVHGVERTDDLASLKVDNFDPGECNDEFLMKKVSELWNNNEITFLTCFFIISLNIFESFANEIKS